MTHNTKITFSTLLLSSFMVFWWILPSWILNMVCISFSMGLVVLGLLVLMRAGLVSFGQGLFFCLGGYSAAMLNVFLGISDAFILIIAGAFLSGLSAYILGFLLRRYRGIFFAMLNLALSMILFGIIVKSVSLGSTDGFSLSAPSFLGVSYQNESRLTLPLYLLTIYITFICGYVVQRYLNSPTGMISEAIKENEIRVSYLGESAPKVVHKIYIISAILAGIGGVLTVLLVGHVTPEDTAYWTKSGEFVFVAILSGGGHVIAPFIGALLFEFTRSYALQYFPDMWQMMLGSILLFVIILLPGGLWSLMEKIPLKRKTKDV